MEGWMTGWVPPHARQVNAGNPFVVRHGTPQVGDNTPLRKIVLRKAVFY